MGEGGKNVDLCASWRRQAIEAAEIACRFDPGNAHYRDELDVLRSRQWAFENDVADGLKKSGRTDLLEVHLPTKSAAVFFESDDSLKAGLQQRISGLRKGLKGELGVTLPGLRFRDDITLSGGQYRLLMRDVTVAEGSLNGEEPQAWWDELAQEVGRVARKRVRDYYGPQDVLNAISAGNRTESQASGIADNPDSLGAATLVLRGLLDEGVSVNAIGPIVSIFEPARRSGENLLSIQERIRRFPGIREELPGNVGLPAVRFVAVGPEVERQMKAVIDRGSSDPHMLEDASSRVAIATALTRPLREPGKADSPGLVLVASKANRPFFARILVEQGFSNVPVLCELELLPEFVAKIESVV